MVGRTGCKVLLRAEIEYRGKITVTHTIELSDSKALIQADQSPPIGASVKVRLSFPRLVAPLVLVGTVAAQYTSERPGDRSAVLIAFEEEAQRTGLRALLSRIDPASPQPMPESAPPANGYRVLVIEDNHMVRDMFSYGVRKYFATRSSPVAIDLAADGEEAWRMLCDSPYDLAIVDFYLPVLDGSKLVARMRNDPRMSEIPVVGISVGGREAKSAMLEAGVDLFLDKPIVLRELFSTLERLTAAEMPA